MSGAWRGRGPPNRAQASLQLSPPPHLQRGVGTSSQGGAIWEGTDTGVRPRGLTHWTGKGTSPAVRSAGTVSPRPETRAEPRAGGGTAAAVAPGWALPGTEGPQVRPTLAGSLVLRWLQRTGLTDSLTGAEPTEASILGSTSQGAEERLCIVPTRVPLKTKGAGPLQPQGSLLLCRLY